MHKAVASAFKLRRMAAERLRLAVLRLRLGRHVAPGRVTIGARVRVIATDRAHLLIGSETAIEAEVTIQAKFGRLEIGAGSFIGQGSVIVARESVTIGKDALIAEYVTIRDQNHGIGRGRPISQSGYSTAPIWIGNNVWLGAKVTVLKGVSIGDNVVVGANSVVTCDLPPNVVAAGVPARVIREIAENEPVTSAKGCPSA